MKIRLKGKRVHGNSVTFRNPTGEQIYLKEIGDISQDVPDTVALNLASAYPDMIEIVHGDYAPKMATAPENKVIRPTQIKAVKPKRATSDEPISPPQEV